MKVWQLLLVIALTIFVIYGYKSMYDKIYYNVDIDEYGLKRGTIINKKIENDKYYFQMKKLFTNKWKSAWFEVEEYEYFSFEIGDYYE